MKDLLEKAARDLTGFSSFHLSLDRNRNGALTKVLLRAYFFTALLEGKSHFAFIGHFRKIPYFTELEEAYCSVHQYRLEEVSTFAEEIFGPKTALIVMASADPYTGESLSLAPYLEQAKKKEIPVHVDMTESIDLQPWTFSASSVDSVSFSLEKIGADIGSLLLSKKDYPYAVEEIGELFCKTALERLQEKKASFTSDLLRLGKNKRLLLKELKNSSVTFTEIPSLSATLVATFPNIYAEALSFRMNARGVATGFHPEYPTKFVMKLSPSQKPQELKSLVAILKEEIEELQKIAGVL